MNKKKRKHPKPYGPSKLGVCFRTQWNNESWGTDGPILCEVCGRTHPRRTDETYVVSRFLGRQVVEECCGAVLDRVYQESGEEFATAFIREFADNPTNPRFYIFLSELKSALLKANKKVSDATTQTLTLKELIAPVQTIAGA
ncbi:MAG: hypothetical protein V1845_01120 [bacterium]